MHVEGLHDSNRCLFTDGSPVTAGFAPVERLANIVISLTAASVVISLTLCELCCGMGRYIADAFCGRTRYIADASIVISLTPLLKKSLRVNTLFRLSTALTRARGFLTFKIS